MFECQRWGGVGVLKKWEKIYRFKTECWAPPTVVISMIPWHLCLSVRGGVVWGFYKNGKKIYRFKTECWAPSTVKSYLWYPDIYVWVLGGSIKNGEKNFTDSKLNVEHPWHLSHIYDTLTFMFECWGWGVGGSIKMGKKFYRFKTECWAPLTFKSFIWYPDIYVWVLGWGGGGGASIKNGKTLLPIQKWMLHESVKLKKIVTFGVSKFYEWILRDT